MARPTFAIDPIQCRRLRDGANKTQLQVAKELHKLLKPNVPEGPDGALISTYQRIERTGRTSRNKATALAKIFNVSVEVLQGNEWPEPNSYVKALAARLAELHESTRNDQLSHAFEKVMKRDEPSSPQEAWKFLAEDVGERIEAAQLSCNPHEIEELAGLTGLSEAEILKPANVSGGHWLVTAAGPYSNASTSIQLGTTSLRGHLQKLIEEELDSFVGDAAVRMQLDEPWFRIEVLRPSLAGALRIDFVRCFPDGKRGLRWAEATWREKFVIGGGLRSSAPEPLAEWAFCTVNFVTDFKGRSFPSDVRRLCLIVTRHDGVAAGRMVIRGYPEELSEERVQSFQKYGESHSLVLSRLSTDLEQSLHPYLRTHSQEYWDVVAVSECVEIKPAGGNCSRAANAFDLRFDVSLHEEIRSGEFIRAPWREDDKKRFAAQIKNWCSRPNGTVGGDVEPRSFELIPPAP